MESVYSLDQVAERLGVSIHSVRSYVSAGRLPVDENRNVSHATLEEAIAARAQHGAWSWYKHCSWYTEPEQVEEDAAADETAPSLAARLVAKAKELRSAGEFERACELFEIVCDEYNF